jgi:hypothetical protein
MALILLCASSCRVFSDFDELTADTSNLRASAVQATTRRAEVRISGGDPRLCAELAEALRAELEDGNLFEELVPLGAVDSSTHGSSEPEKSKLGNGPNSGSSSATDSILQLTLKSRRSEAFGNIFSDKSGWAVRYEIDVSLQNFGGEVLASGPVVGLAYDDDTRVFSLSENQRHDIELAAQRDIGVKIADVLEQRVEKSFEEALKSVPTLVLRPGVGPLRIAILNIDLRRAHPKIRGSQVESDLRVALELAGGEIEILDTSRLERVIEAEDLPEVQGLSLPKEVVRWLNTELPSRYVLLVELTATASRVEIAAAMFELTGEGQRFVVEARGEARGLGAARLAVPRLVEGLIEALGRFPFSESRSSEDAGEKKAPPGGR